MNFAAFGRLLFNGFGVGDSSSPTKPRWARLLAQVTRLGPDPERVTATRTGPDPQRGYRLPDVQPLPQ